MAEHGRLSRTAALLAATALLLLGACESASSDGLNSPGLPSQTSSPTTGEPTGGDEPEEGAEQDAEAPPTDGATGPANGTGSAAPAGNGEAGASDRSTLAVLATLEVKGRAPKTGYSREQFGPAWLDADRNGCDTRNDMLRRDLADITVQSGTNGCVVLTGLLIDDYTGKRIDHVRGQGNLVDIDHRVALSNAWQTGAGQWSLEKRAAFANDPLNLIATDAGANRSKGDGDAATWLPPRTANRCDYVATQVAVKAKYGLWVTPAERDAIVRVLQDCPGHQLPADAANAPTEVDHNLKPVAKASPPPAPKATPAPKPKPTPTPAPAKVFKNCTEARAAGAAPVHRGDPGYGTHLDRDGDGIGCE